MGPCAERNRWTWLAALNRRMMRSRWREFSARLLRDFTGEHFWAHGYAVSTVGFELEQVRAYIRDQEATDEEGRF
jgi:REP element-mobilizing transposase RayT